MFDHNGRRGEEYEEEIIAHIYHRLRKVNNKATRAQPNYENQAAHKYIDEQQMPFNFTERGYCNWSCVSHSYDGGPYNCGYNQIDVDCGTLSNTSYPSYLGIQSKYQNHDNFHIFNHDTINYGDHHYYRPIIHGGDSTEQGIDSGYMVDQSEENNYQEPPCRSF
ncbi:hypothetical protein Cgig2_004865 [Carnegiea gigantea]|uniref:Uncharacterized protein n=1 Tax=Carnegiea gigantea TaxID=171969 RepID=A0A9Q1JYG3_9CARY|nr:hypothetical protein Cgig2_004865 [Carnegiea gigantea]